MLMCVFLDNLVTPKYIFVRAASYRVEVLAELACFRIFISVVIPLYSAAHFLLTSSSSSDCCSSWLLLDLFIC